MPRKRGGLADWIADANLPVLVLDERHRVRVFNHGASRLTGVAPGEILGRRCQIAGNTPLTGPEAVLDAFAVVASSFRGEPTTLEVTLPRSATSAGSPANTQQAILLPLAHDAAFAETAEAHDRSSDTQNHLLIAITSSPLTSIPKQATLVSHALLRIAAESLLRTFGIRYFVANDPAMKRVVRQIRIAAETDASVIIDGKPGTGRTHVARTILRTSNCDPTRVATIDGSAMQGNEFASLVSEMLGTGRDHPSHIILDHLDRWAAEDICLLRDHLSLDAGQAVVIAVIDSKAGTSADLSSLIDLVGDVTVRIPELRDRRSDIPALSQAFLEQQLRQAAEQSEQPVPLSFAEPVLNAFEEYTWPGQVTELSSVVAAAARAALGESRDGNDSIEQISFEHLPSSFHLGVDAQNQPPDPPIRSLSDVLEEAERAHLLRALAVARGQKARAALLLNMSRPKLYRRLEQLGIEQSGIDQAE